MALAYTSSVLFLLFLYTMSCQNSSEYDLVHVRSGQSHGKSHRMRIRELVDGKPGPMDHDPMFYEANYGQTSDVSQPDELNLEQHLRPNFTSEIPDLKCDFEADCPWQYNTTMMQQFKVVTSEEINVINKATGIGKLSFPLADGSNNKDGHYLYLELPPKMNERSLRSPMFRGSRLKSCTLEFLTHQNNMHQSTIKIIVENSDHKLMIQEMVGNNNNGWNRHRVKLGIINDEFRIVLEVVPSPNQSQLAHIAVDNLNLVQCIQEDALQHTTMCAATEIQCTVNKIPICINSSKICDITVDCDSGEDEMQDCDNIPPGGRCDFETDWCGWSNAQHGREGMKWWRHQGKTNPGDTRPVSDHTYRNATGTYLYTNMSQTKNNVQQAIYPVLVSTIFNPPPRVHGNRRSNYFNSCMIRFYYHQFSLGTAARGINLYLIEITPNENITTPIWNSPRHGGQKWSRAEIVLPNVTTLYFLQFEGRLEERFLSDVAIDDVSMSPECFGINIPLRELDGYDYWDPHFIPPSVNFEFENKKVYTFTTCHAKGRNGPTQENCDNAYKKSAREILVMGKVPYRGVQVWTVPDAGYHTVFVKGAGGGRGSDGVGSTRGATARIVVKLHKFERIYILVGQQGSSPCNDDLRSDSGSSFNIKYRNKTYESINTGFNDKVGEECGGGGGGGGSFVFMLNHEYKRIPFAVGAGGGGLGVGRYVDEGNQHGHVMNNSEKPHFNYMYGKPTETAGIGGGWDPYMGPIIPEVIPISLVMGQALVRGAQGGAPCISSGGQHGGGGFGGGGGGCTKGGGGGGYYGGDTSSSSKNGDGGYSFVGGGRELKELSKITAGSNSGDGIVIIIPGILGCNCDYQCVALDEFRSEVQCICPVGFFIKHNDPTKCQSIDKHPVTPPFVVWMTTLFIVLAVVKSVALTVLCIIYNRPVRRKVKEFVNKWL